MSLLLSVKLLLCGAALIAGIVDAIAGGGGLITLPALLAAGVPPHLALGTNKGQSVFGSGASLWRYARGGLVDRAQARVTFPLGLVGSLAGARLVLWISPEQLKPLVLVLLVAVAVFLTLRRPRAPGTAAVPVARPLLAAGVVALVVGAYDGFFGPGTGTFLIVAFVALLGRNLAAASADAKVVNFASNLAAVVLFARADVVLWSVALPMAVAQATGGFIGAHLAIRGGERLVRPVVLVVVLALVAKLLHDLLVR
jgi:uncharacterized membrane protein YfcA